jgi:transcriptional regulator with XRE-family HTH domain
VDAAAKARPVTLPRPIEAHEIPCLEALGAMLVALQHEAGMTVRALSGRAQVSERHLDALRAGVRRTRAATLRRIATSLAERLDVGPEEIHQQLVDAAGCSLAPPSEFQDRIDRRRQRRLDRAVAKEATVQRRVAEFQAKFPDIVEELERSKRRP